MPGSGAIGTEIAGSRAQITRSRAAWMGEKITQAAAQSGGYTRAGDDRRWLPSVI